MSTIAPKDKAFLDIKLVQECMDAHGGRLAIAFAEWITDNNYVRGTGRWYKSAGGPLLTTECLYNKFIESITK